jgi:hypothetical protein
MRSNSPRAVARHLQIFNAELAVLSLAFGILCVVLAALLS